MSQVRSDSLEMSTIHVLLSDETRRAALRRLGAVERTTIQDLMRYLVTDDRTAGVAEHVDSRTLTIRLIHDHLPRLAEHGVVDYENPGDGIQPGPTFDDVAPFIDPLERSESQ